MLNRLRLFLSVGLLGIFTACGPKEIKTQVSLSANRVMGYSLRFIGTKPTADRVTFFQGIAEQGLKDAYGAKITRLQFQENSMLEEPENLYQLGFNQIDDFLLFNIDDRSDASETSITVYNGANLKTVTILKFSVPREGLEPFGDRYVQTFKRVALQNFPNPNIYPKSDPLHFANLLFIYSQQREKNLTENLSCENAPQILHYYSKAQELYEMAKEKAFSRTVGAQEQTHQLTSRLQEATEKKNVLQRCIDDSKRSFELQIDFGKIDAANHDAIKKALEASGLETLLKQYTSKPVELRLKLEDNGELNMLLSVRFDQSRYLAWIKGNAPTKIRNYSILSLNPFHALMQKMVVFRSSLPPDASSTLRASFAAMRMTLALNTILTGQVLLGVDGKYDSKTKSISMAYPNSLILQSPGFENKPIQGRDKEIFQEKTWIALGNCKTLDGSFTEDGLVLRFFGLPCT